LRVLIVGSRSTLGRHLANRLKITHEVRMAGRDPAADIAFDMETGVGSGAGEAFDVIINCAARFGGATLAEETAAVRVNVAAMPTLVALARRTGASQIVNVSSISVYGPPENEMFNLYGLTKRQGEDLLTFLGAQAGIRVVHLRVSGLYDAERLFAKRQPFLYMLIDRAKKGEQVTLFGRVDVRRNYLFSSDVAAMIEGTIEARLEGVFDCVSPESPTVSEMAEQAFNAAGRAATFSFDESQPDMKRLHIPRGDGLYRALGFTPTVGLVRGYEAILASDSLRP